MCASQMAKIQISAMFIQNSTELLLYLCYTAYSFTEGKTDGMNLAGKQLWLKEEKQKFCSQASLCIKVPVKCVSVRQPKSVFHLTSDNYLSSTADNVLSDIK